MKYSARIIMIISQLIVISGYTAVEFDVDGATPGKWTMDFDTAKNLAAETKLPILLDFSGSDWCGWCKVMEEEVFTRPEWKAYATNHLVMVFIDFPRDNSLLPERYVERNNALKDKYGVRGYPTFVVLDDDGETELGRLRAARDKTPESFQEELQNLFRFRSAEINKYCATLNPEEQGFYRGLFEGLSAEKMALEVARKVKLEADRRVRELEGSVEKMEGKLIEFSVRRLKDIQNPVFYDNFNDDSWESNWKSFTNGCSIQEKSETLQVSGTFLESGWKGNGLTYKKNLNGRSFSTSVKFSTPKLKGKGTKLVWLSIKGEDSRDCGIYYQPEHGYGFMTSPPQAFNGSKECFGDEENKFHELKIIYSAELNHAVGFVDGSRIGNLPISLTGELDFNIYVNSGSTGIVTNVSFDDFEVHSL